jgi:3-oxoacyl-[acyl-carrier protein] reductase
MNVDAEIANAFSLEGRVAVITGAASGLGREAARIFASAGASLVLADIDTTGVAATAALVRKAGGRAVARETDVSDRGAMDSLAEAAVREMGGLDIWINSAGITIWAGVTEAAQADAERMVAINLMGTFWGCAAAGRTMQAQGRGGTIINVSSTAGDSPVPTLSVYGMTKAGVNQLTRICAGEFGPSGIRVNAVVPGFIDTPIIATMYRDAAGNLDHDRRAEIFAQMRGLSPLGLTGEPSDIAFALLYLASDASRFVTGQLLRVSGGV